MKIDDSTHGLGQGISKTDKADANASDSGDEEPGSWRLSPAIDMLKLFWALEIKESAASPVVLDVGTKNEKLRKTMNKSLE